MRRIDSSLVVLLTVLVARHVVQAVDIPYFAMKLIVVGMPEDIDENFEMALNEATVSHLSTMLAEEVNTEAPVELESTFVKAKIPLNLTQGVDLTVVNVAYHGTVDIGIAQNVDLTPFLESAFGKTEGFPTFSKALESEERLHGIGKLQVGLNDVIVGEGNLIASAGHEDEEDEHDVPPYDDDDDNEDDGLSRKSLILIIVLTLVAWIVLVYGAYIVWRIQRDRKLEKRKLQRRQANKTRRLAYADGRSSSHTNDFSTGSDYSPSKRSSRKKVPKPSKMMISKPSKLAKRQKSLLAIAEQDEESSCAAEEPSSIEDSFVSCESTESVPEGRSKLPESISLTAGISVRPQRTSRFQPQDTGVGIDRRMDHLSVGSSSVSRQHEKFRSPQAAHLQTPKNPGNYEEKMPGMFVKQRTTGTFEPFSQDGIQGQGKTKAATGIERKPLETLPNSRDSSFSSFGANTSIPAIRTKAMNDSQTSTEKPLWSDLMSSVNSSTSMLSAARRGVHTAVHPSAKNDSQSTMGSAVWGDLLSSTNSMVQSTTIQNHGNLSLNSENQSLGSTTNGSTDIFLDDGIDQTRRNRTARHADSSQAKQTNRSRESPYDGALSNDLEMSCAYVDIGDETMGNKSIRWDTSIDLAGYGDQNTQLDVGYGSDCHSGSSSTGPGWRLT